MVWVLHIYQNALYEDEWQLPTIQRHRIATVEWKSPRIEHVLSARKEECYECIIHIRNMEKYCYFIFTELGAVAAFDIMMIIAILRQIFCIGVVER